MASDRGASSSIEVRCCVVGGGPAGMMLGFLLARAGVDVIVLEKHADFLRDFRGDTIHPSTLEVMVELGIVDEFLRQPHDKVSRLEIQIGDNRLTVADFSHLPTHCKFVAFMPQWDFLNFIAAQGQRYPSFQLIKQAEAIDLIQENGRVVGVKANVAGRGELAIRTGLTVAADGRDSILRAKAGLIGDDLGAPMDVLWMRLSQHPGDPEQTMGRIDSGRILAMLDRGSYWQCAYVIPKGGFEDVRQRGLDYLREDIARLAPFLRDRVDELRGWDDIKLLTVSVDRLHEWYKPGFLCIGDAAHAMSPIGGVGINLAIQDAVAAANILAQPLLQAAVTTEHLRAVQRRRAWPTEMTQRTQLFLQNRVIRNVLNTRQPLSLPWPMKLLRRWPLLQRIPARLVGMGFRPEHVKTPDATTRTTR